MTQQKWNEHPNSPVIEPLTVVTILAVLAVPVIAIGVVVKWLRN